MSPRTEPYVSPPIDHEERAWKYMRQTRDARRQYQATASERTARLVGEYRATYPHMTEGVMLSLAKAGVRPDEPLAQRTAQQTAQMQKEGGGGGGVFGDIVSGLGKVGSAVVSGLSAAAEPIKPALRTVFTALDAPLREATGRVGQVLTGSGDTAARVGTVAGGAIGAAAGTALAPGLGTGVGASIGGAIGGGLLGAGAGGLAGEALGGKGEVEVFSPGLMAARDVVRGNKVSLGSGYFPGGDIFEAHRAKFRELGEQAGLEREFTVGRFFANKVFEPGSVPYNIMSGTVDLGLILRDPAFVGSKAGGSARRARRTFEPVLGERNLGMFKGHRATVVPEKFEKWAIGEGQRYFEEAARRDTGDLWRIYTNGGKRNDIPLGFIHELGESRNATEAASTFRRWVTEHRKIRHMPRHVSGVKGQVRDAVPGGWPTWFANKRQLGNVPGDDIFSRRDPEGSLASLEASLRNAKVDVAERDRLVGDAVRAIASKNEQKIYKSFVTDYTNAIRRALVAEGHGISTQRDEFVENFERFAGRPGVAAAVRRAEEAGRTPNPGAIWDDLIDRGHPDVIDKSWLNRMTGLWRERNQNMRGMWVDEYGKPHHHVLAEVDDESTLVQGSPHAFLEMHTDRVPNMDWRRLRRTIKSKPMRKLLSKDVDDLMEPRAAVAALDWATRNWKPFAVARPAYVMRVTAAIEHARLAADGAMSVMSNPVRAMRWMAHRTGAQDFRGAEFPRAWDRTGRLTKRLAKVEDEIFGTAKRQPATGDRLRKLQAEADDITERLNRVAGDDFQDWQQAMSGSLGAALRSEVNQKYSNHVPVNLGEFGFEHGVARKIALLSQDPVYTKVLNRNRDDAVDWFLNSDEGTRLRGRMVQSRWGSTLENDDVARDYVDEVYERAQALTGGDPDLMRFMRGERPATGATGDVADSVMDRVFDLTRNREFRGTPSVFVDETIINPDLAKRQRNLLRGVQNFLTSSMLEVPTDVASRSNHFRFAYWRWLARNGDALDPGELEKVARIGGETGVPKELLRQARQKSEAASEAGRVGRLTAEEADKVAAAHAAVDVGDLLWDFSKRNQFFDAWRVAFPFGDAWLEEAKVWGRLIQDEPQILRRFQQGIDGMRSQGLAETVAGIPIMGLGVPTETFDPDTGEWNPAGFFHTNSFGDEVFTYPFTGWFNEKLFGVPIPLSGRAQGITMIGEVLPGVGPATQVPLSWLIPNTPDWRDIDQALFPFGRAEEVGKLGPASKFMPAWVDRVTSALGWRDEDQQRIHGNNVKSIASYLVSSGTVPRPDTPGKVRELMEMAQQRSGGFFLMNALGQSGADGAGLMRGLLSAVLPASPQFEWLAVDKDGQLTTAEALRQEFHHMREKDPETATARFMLRHGEQAFLHTTAYTQALTYAAPVTSEGVEWADRHPEVRESLPNTYGLFAPAGGDFMYDAYIDQLNERGERQPLTFEQWMQLGHTRIARNIVEAARQMAGPNPGEQQQRALRGLKRQLQEEYPGYWPGFGAEVPGVARRITTGQAVEELRRFEQHPDLAESDVGEALRTYLAARDTAARAGETPTTFASAQAFRGVRTNLRSLAQKLMQETPQFGPLWDQVFERELTDDLE